MLRGNSMVYGTKILIPEDPFRAHCDPIQNEGGAASCPADLCTTEPYDYPKYRYPVPLKALKLHFLKYVTAACYFPNSRKTAQQIYFADH